MNILDVAFVEELVDASISGKQDGENITQETSVICFQMMNSIS